MSTKCILMDQNQFEQRFPYEIRLSLMSRNNDFIPRSIDSADQIVSKLKEAVGKPAICNHVGWGAVRLEGVTRRWCRRDGFLYFKFEKDALMAKMML